MKNSWILLLFIISTLACERFTDVPPKGQMIPTTAEDFESILNNPDLGNTSETYILGYLSDDAYIPDMILPVFATLPYISNAYRWENTIYTDQEKDELWSGAYNRIFSYNIIIDHVLGSEGDNTDYKRSIWAEALVGRAMEYFYLVNAYGPAYDAVTANEDFAVPLILKADINQKEVKKASVASIYNQIINDLEQAIPALPDQPKLNNRRASKSAAYGLLARIGLYMGNYKLAEKYASLVLTIHNTLLDLNDFDVIDPNISIGRNNLPDAKNNPEVFYNRSFPYPYGPAGLVWMSDDLKNKFKEGDRRLELYYSYFFEMMGMELPWLNYCAYVKSSIAPGVPEMLLTRAECYARAGDSESLRKALNDLDNLRKMRFDKTTYQKLESTDASEVLQWVLDERRCELAFMGLRLFDQKRLNKESAFSKNVTRIIEGQEKVLTPNSPQYILPIWPKVTSMNPNL